MKIAPDTNILVRIITEDDPLQSQAAQRTLQHADLVAVTLPALCELAWVLSTGYNISAREVAVSIRMLVNSANVAVDRPAVDAGLAMLDAGGDFADGVIAHEGNWLGADTFLSFDRKAIRLLTARGHRARTP